MSLLAVAVSLLVNTAAFADSRARVFPKDFAALINVRWAGTLTYVDYGTNRRIAIPTELRVSPAKNDRTSFIFMIQYPHEPKANSAETVVIGDDGSSLSGETVVERRNEAGRILRIVTEKDGTDNNRKARLRYTYLIGRGMFRITKETRADGEVEYRFRNEYSWTAKPVRFVHALDPYGN